MIFSVNFVCMHMHLGAGKPVSQRACGGPRVTFKGLFSAPTMLKQALPVPATVLYTPSELGPCTHACVHACTLAHLRRACVSAPVCACLGFLRLPPTWHRSAGMEEACCVTWVLGLVLGPSSLSDKHYLSPPPPSSHAIPLAQIELISLTMAAALSAPLKPTLFPCQAAYLS